MSTRSGRKSFDNETLLAIGGRIRSARGETTQEDFAAAIGVSRSALTNYEAGRRLPNDLILTRISEISGCPVPQLLFGQTVVPFEAYRHRVEEEAIREAQKRPGFIPRFMISDDELALISLLRWMDIDSSPLPIVKSVLEHAKGVIASQRLPGAPAVAWGEAYLERLETAVSTGRFEHGYDPDYHYWVTFWEQRDAGSE